MPRKSLFAIAALAVASLLTGCTGIPFTGQVSKGVPIVNDVNSDIQYLPAGPSDSASPEQIVRGFVEAGTSPAGDWKIARQYLSTSFARKWDPRARVIVDSGTRTISGGSETGLSLSTQVRATVDSLGNYLISSPETPAKYAFTFVQEKGQWRIESAPSGIIIDSATFPRVFSATPLFFYAAGTSTLVPDMRWFPSRVSTSTRVIKALTKGPAAWLAATGEVVTAIPQGADLVADTVPVESGVASVNLDSRTIKITDTLGERVLRQVAASLVGVPEISAVSLYFSGNLQGQTPVPSLQTLVSPSSAPPTFAMHDGKFGYFDGSRVSPLLGDLSTQIERLKPTSVALATDRSIAVANTPQGVVLLRANRPTTVIDNRPGLLPAVIDADGFIWTASSSAPRQFRVTNALGASRTVAITWGENTRLSALTISPEGTRAVIGFVGGGSDRLCTVSIGRGDDGWPTRVGACRSLEAPSGAVMSAAWLDSMRVAVLTDSRTPNLRVLTIGGTYVDLTPPLGAVQVHASGKAGGTRVLTSFGELYDQSATSRWTSVGSKVSLLASTQ